MSAPQDTSAGDVPPVVPAAWVRERHGSAEHAALVLADVRWYLDGRSGQDAYLAGHLPGAVWVDVDTDLSAPPAPDGGRHPLPAPEEFAARLGRLGIADDDIVVAYDDQGGGFAARLVWLLRRTGRAAALLDGGLAAWPGPLQAGPVRRTPVVRRATPWPARLLRGADDAARAGLSPRAVLLDSRAAGRYSGADAHAGETRSGHVPGARSAPWQDNLGPDGTFRSAEELRARFAQLGVADAEEPVFYCGSGVTACHNLLAVERAGLPDAALFPGSWSAWSADPDRPVVAGSRPFAPDGPGTPAPAGPEAGTFGTEGAPR
ncbi:thiosulfate/3-mercaptopyruvate sulfurtransferase [Actinacidiphila yanglinensis]|uniref:Thiosulfate/3-mercaptopyruvate sulfurtransferase n=1 Tax=Actinacidiphila yanglinensis TaxID=310779 RepID=A0A1H6DS33_9ACTN|nr:sulfurtransferase [Actinacidiphila yanglinensis]SEG87526.1 thiosulfate/3-mercaptopyruvate sulfurtransferase [Actinacidiphila yanglinensis]